MLSLKAPGKNLSLLLLASGGCRQTLVFLGWWQPRSNPRLAFIRSSSPCLSVSNVASSYKDTRRWVRTHSNQVWLHLNLITSAKTLIPNKVSFGGTRIRIEHIFLGYTIQPTTSGVPPLLFTSLLFQFSPHSSLPNHLKCPLHACLISWSHMCGELIKLLYGSLIFRLSLLTSCWSTNWYFNIKLAKLWMFPIPFPLSLPFFLLTTSLSVGFHLLSPIKLASAGRSCWFSWAVPSLWCFCSNKLRAGGWEVGWEAKRLQNPTLCTQIQQIFINECLSICCLPLVNFPDCFTHCPPPPFHTCFCEVGGMSFDLFMLILCF